MAQPGGISLRTVPRDRQTATCPGRTRRSDAVRRGRRTRPTRHGWSAGLPAARPLTRGPGPARRGRRGHRPRAGRGWPACASARQGAPLRAHGGSGRPPGRWTPCNASPPGLYEDSEAVNAGVDCALEKYRSRSKGHRKRLTRRPRPEVWAGASRSPRSRRYRPSPPLCTKARATPAGTGGGPGTARRGLVTCITPAVDRRTGPGVTAGEDASGGVGEPMARGERRPSSPLCRGSRPCGTRFTKSAHELTEFEQLMPVLVRSAPNDSSPAQGSAQHGPS